MLTGDKGVTAKEIGITCGLITPSHNLRDERVSHNEISLNDSRNSLSDLDREPA